MKKTYSLLSIIIIGSISLASYAKPTFVQDQLEQFEKTNKCSGCDLSGAPLSANHSGAILIGANLSSVYYYDGPFGLNLSGANLRNVNFSSASLEGANFSQADLTGAVFAGARLNYANFYGAKGVDLKNAAEACNITAPDGSYMICKTQQD